MKRLPSHIFKIILSYGRILGLNKIGIFRSITDAYKRYVGDTIIPFPIFIQSFKYKGISIQDYIYGSYESETTALFKRLIKPGMTVLDIGAQRGYFTLLLSRLVGSSGRVYSFEPFAPVFMELRTNIQRNCDAKNIIAVQKGVGSSKKIESYYIPSASIYPVKHENISVDNKKLIAQIEIVRLDDYFEECMPRIHFIKMDIEGAELEALAGMKQIFAQNPSLMLVIEIAPKVLDSIGVDPSLLIQKLHSYGFTLNMILANGTTKEADDEIILKNARINRYINILCTRQERL